MNTGLFDALNPEMFLNTDFNDTEMFDNELGINFFIAESIFYSRIKFFIAGKYFYIRLICAIISYNFPGYV